MPLVPLGAGVGLGAQAVRGVWRLVRVGPQRKYQQAQGLVDQPLAAMASVPDGTEPGDYSDVPAGPCDPEVFPNPGRAIARHWHKRPRHFLDVLRQLDPVEWWPMAESYSAWRNCSTQHTLDIWFLAVQGTNVPTNARAA